MAFITLALKNSIEHFPGRAWGYIRLGLLLSGLLFLANSHAAGIEIQSAQSHLNDNVHLMDADIGYTFSEEALEALANGIPLTVRLDIEVQRKRSWYLPDADVASLEQRYQLLFHALSDRYLVINLNSGTFYAYPTRASAIYALGIIRDFPLLDDKLIEKGEAYDVYIRAALDIESLPSPLRPVAYLTPAWRLKSEWYSWSLTP